MEEIVYLNGELIPRSNANVSVYDHGFLYGYGLFETMRAYNGTIFLLDRHLKRLHSSAEAIGLSTGLADIDLAEACYNTLKANDLKEARLRLTVTRGEADSFAIPVIAGKLTVLVTAISYSPLPAEIYENGFKAGVSSFFGSSRSVLSGHKSTSYLISVLAKMEAGASGFEESLLLNEKNCLTEGSISNIFFVSADSKIVTPPLESGILPGITRGMVMELADAVGINVHEKDITIAGLVSFKEAFLTNSVMEIMPLVAVADNSGKIVTIGSGKQGRLTKKLMTAYRELVAKEIG